MRESVLGLPSNMGSGDGRRGQHQCAPRNTVLSSQNLPDFTLSHPPGGQSGGGGGAPLWAWVGGGHRGANPRRLSPGSLLRDRLNALRAIRGLRPGDARRVDPGSSWRSSRGASEGESGLSAHTRRTPPEVDVASVRAILAAAAPALQKVSPLTGEITLERSSAKHPLLIHDPPRWSVRRCAREP
jgi:hypothetical protein